MNSQRLPSRVALCLNSSFLGFYAHGGFVQALTELGVRPAAISGASAGALVAGLFAAGVTPARMQELFNSPQLPRAFREPGAPWRGFATLANLRGHTGAVRGDRALALLRELLGDRRIEDCQDPRLALSITNLSQARSEIATRGPLAELILASGAFPGVFAARPVEGDYHWDGGVANPLPFDHWFTDPSIDAIIIHVVANPEELAVRRLPGPLRMSGAVNLSHQIICDELLRLKTELARHAGKRLIVLRTLAPRPRLWNPVKVGARCLEIGRATVAENRAVLAELAT
jgi:predicted acylesterase/phospholipase RssA